MRLRGAPQGRGELRNPAASNPRVTGYADIPIPGPTGRAKS